MSKLIDWQRSVIGKPDWEIFPIAAIKPLILTLLTV